MKHVTSKIISLTPDQLPRFGTQSAWELEWARAIACAVIEKYGDFDEAEWATYRKHGIWNDHPAVQAALAALRMGLPSREAVAH